MEGTYGKEFVHPELGGDNAPQALAGSAEMPMKVPCVQVLAGASEHVRSADPAWALSSVSPPTQIYDPSTRPVKLDEDGKPVTYHVRCCDGELDTCLVRAARRAHTQG